MVLSVAYVSSPYFFKAPTAESAATDNVYGWAWSYGGEDIDPLNPSYAGGWISFNSTDCDANGNNFIDAFCVKFKSDGVTPNDDLTISVIPYGVNLNISGDGSLSGIAWSPNMGWISFDRGRTSNPPEPPFDSGTGPIAKIDNFGNLIGWARALQGCQDNLWNSVDKKCTGSGSGDNTGQWDGWIKLSKDPSDGGVAYGVKLSGTKFSGYAWGSDSGGWIDFDPKKADGTAVGGVYLRNSSSVCTTATPGVKSTGCISSQACTTPPSLAVESLDGIDVFTCPDSSQTSINCKVDVTCTVVTPVGTCGDNKCGGNPTMTETPSSCPKDCKPGYKQF